MTNMEKSAAARLPAAGSWLQRIFSALGRAQARRTALRELYALDNRLLRDIGLRRDQVGDTVSAMFRAGPVAEAAPSSREVPSGHFAAAGGRNDDHYQSAA
jgi:uncharacterized protein YjiS (DUF1127 family)